MRNLALSLAVAAAAMTGHLCAARQASNFNITASEARAHDCGTECQRILSLTNPADLDIVGHDFDFDFYETAANFSGSKPGDVLKLKSISPEEERTWEDRSRDRIHCVSFSGNMGPDGASTGSHGASKHNGTYKLVAWAHGTIGLFAGCAPSNGPDMFDYNSWQALTTRGYAVVATDYAGLGNNATTHKYCSFDSHATDVYYSVVAARKLFGGALSREWVSVGHSQGGGTAWKLAESEFVRHDEGYLGTVALSPATYVVDMLLGGMSKGGDGSSGGKDDDIDRNVIKYPGYLPYLPLAVERANPAFHSTLLSPTMQKRVQLGKTKQLCTNALMGLTFDLPAPVLVVQGLNDTSVLAPTTEQAWNASCGYGNAVHLSEYPGVEHSPLPATAEAEWMGWIDWRFAGGRYADGKCSRVTRRALFGGKWTKTPPEFRLPKFLGGGRGNKTSWADEL
ncbi:hypothetical protein ACCO45_007501 [Purpureocillium lilacinum]|uniref:Uncharacterized protein n=1 Tax=Purpureocillium lilacinum TaxID=33203 RepID=A0ACC4DUV5_PURLI